MGDKFLVHGYGHVGLGSVVVAGTVALLGTCHEGELADQQYAAVGYFGDGQVHHPVGIVEDTQSHNLATEPVDVLIAVGILNAEQYHHTGADGSLYFASNADGGLSTTLNYYFHALRGLL